MSSSEELADIIQDARHFIDIYEIPILESVPNIYISALAFTLVSSKYLPATDVRRLQRLLGLHLPESFPEGPLSTEIGPSQANCLHITTCLEIMAEELRFNIFTLPSSFMRNKDVQNLQALLEANMSSRLRYACCHWTDQVSRLENPDADLLEMVSRFFRTHFLHWLEVMSILALSPIDALKNLNTVRVCDSMISATMT